MSFCSKICSLFYVMFSFSVWAQTHTEMKKITSGTYQPLYGVDSSRIFVKGFYLDVYPVTNAQFLAFVLTHKEWRKSKVKRIFADEMYLSHWKNDTTINTSMHLQSPITQISWFSAKAYCECQGKRLPTVDEWEYAAMANETKPNAQRDSAFNHRIVSSYEIPKTYSKKIGSTYKNYWGIYDMHGLVWEWTSDFNSVLISGESRQDNGTNRDLFCAAGSLNATNLMDYAAFMRYAFRGSLKANYNVQNLGFRCAKSIQ
jgi:sulfatase modifying factor 1